MDMLSGAKVVHIDAAWFSACQGLAVLICSLGFEAALYGFIVALILGALGVFLKHKQKKIGKPLIAVFKKLFLFCLVLIIPGSYVLLTTGHLPKAGCLHVSALFFMAFWALMSLHLSAEEMNFEWF